jgi:hypothetical protein
VFTADMVSLLCGGALVRWLDSLEIYHLRG